MQCGGGYANRDKVEKPSSPPCQQMDGFESSQPSRSWIGTVGTSNRQQLFPPFWQLGMEGRPRCLRTDEAKDEEGKDGSGHATVWVVVLAAEQYTSITHMCEGLVHVAYYYDVLWYVCTIPGSLLVGVFFSVLYLLQPVSTGSRPINNKQAGD